MEAKGFNHVTVNTGHNVFQAERKFDLGSVDKARLRDLAQKALNPEGAKIIGNITFEAMEVDDGYVGTLFSHIGGRRIPLLTTLGAKTEEAGEIVWAMLQECYPKNRAVISMKNKRPRAPFVADLIHDCCFPDWGAIMFFVSGMSGSFCACMGWAFLFPEAIAPDSSNPRSETQDSRAMSTSQLRPSHKGLSGIRKDNYGLPEELRDFNFYYNDGTGHVVMAIPESLLPKAIASGNFDSYECPVPCRYVLAKGYRFHEGYIVCDVPYNRDVGVDIAEYWYDE